MKNPLKKIIIALIILTVVKGLIFAIIVPKYEAPDENRYFKNIELLSVGKIPFFQIKSETGHPILYEVVALPFYLIAKPFGKNAIFLAIRFLSVLLLTFTVYLGYLTAREMFPESGAIQILTPTLITLNPQLSFLSASINAEILLNLLFSSYLLLLIKIAKKKVNPKLYLGFFAILATGFLTKERFFIGLPLIIIVFIYKTLVQFFGKKPKRHLKTKKGWYKLPASAIAGLSIAFISYRFSSTIVSYFYSFLDISVNEEFSFSHFGPKLFRQFWGFFGWLQIPLPNSVYLCLYIFCAIALVGIFLFLAKGIFLNDFKKQGFNLFLLGLSIALAFLSTLSYELANKTSQGRYLFIVIVPITLFLSIGLKQVSTKKLQSYSIAIVFGGLAILNIYSLFWRIFPYYH